MSGVFDKSLVSPLILALGATCTPVSEIDWLAADTDLISKELPSTLETPIPSYLQATPASYRTNTGKYFGLEPEFPISAWTSNFSPSEEAWYLPQMGLPDFSYNVSSDEVRTVPAQEVELPKSIKLAMTSALQDIQAKVHAVRQKATPLKLPGMPAKHKIYYDLCLEMLGQPQLFHTWLADIFEEVAIRQCQQLGAHSCIDIDGRLSLRRAIFRQVAEERARLLGFRGFENVNRTLGSKGFNDIHSAGKLFWDDIFMHDRHGSEAHALQVLYMAETAANHGIHGPKTIYRFVRYAGKNFAQFPILGSLIDIGIKNSLQSPFTISDMTGPYIV